MVPDSLLLLATNALIASGFTLCKDSDCEELREDRHPPDSDDEHPIIRGNQPISPREVRSILAHNRYHAIADAHFHIGSKYSFYTTLSLYNKSSTLWWLPDIQLGPPVDDDPNLMLSNDPQLLPFKKGGSSGPWIGLYPIKALKPSPLAEAIILLLCRDYGDVKHVYRGWVRMSCALVGQKGHTMNREAIERSLKPQFLPVWHSFTCCGPEGQNIYIPLRQLRDKLIENNELPHLPPVDLEEMI